jgi:hypothetical protein
LTCTFDVFCQYREAYEEVALPLGCPHVYTICVLEPFISKYKLLVTPVIVFLTDPAVLDNLRASEAEVDRIFDHPLEALLDPPLASEEPLVVIGSEDWPYETEYHVSRIFIFCVISSDCSSRIHPIYRYHGLAIQLIACIDFVVWPLQLKD